MVPPSNEGNYFRWGLRQWWYLRAAVASPRWGEVATDRTMIDNLPAAHLAMATSGARGYGVFTPIYVKGCPQGGSE